jgi:hypothetical protein
MLDPLRKIVVLGTILMGLMGIPLWLSPSPAWRRERDGRIDRGLRLVKGMRALDRLDWLLLKLLESISRGLRLL